MSELVDKVVADGPGQTSLQDRAPSDSPCPAARHTPISQPTRRLRRSPSAAKSSPSCSAAPMRMTPLSGNPSSRASTTCPAASMASSSIASTSKSSTPDASLSSSTAEPTSGRVSSGSTHRYPKAHIVAVEPAPDNFALLKRNIAGLDVDAVEAGISPIDCSARLADPGRGGYAYQTTTEATTGTEVSMVSIPNHPRHQTCLSLYPFSPQGRHRRLRAVPLHRRQPPALTPSLSLSWSRTTGCFPGKLSSQPFFRFPRRRRPRIRHETRDHRLHRRQSRAAFPEPRRDLGRRAIALYGNHSSYWIYSFFKHPFSVQLPPRNFCLRHLRLLEPELRRQPWATTTSTVK